jgi:hypothetical protein
MATRLYLRNTVVASGAPPSGERFAALPVGTFKGTATENDEKLSLLTTKGTTETSRTLVSLAQETHQDNYLARFVSESLSAQTIAANTWSFGISTAQDSGFAESFFAISLYVYRPSTDTVVGYITDSDTPRGTEWANNKEGRTFTISGSAVMAQAGDVLVLEVWRHGVMRFKQQQTTITRSSISTRPRMSPRAVRRVLPATWRRPRT